MIDIEYFSAAKPEQIPSDTSENTLARYANPRTNDLEILHVYTLYNKGPSDAKRTEVKLMWPMLPNFGFNEQIPLLYGIDLPNISRPDSKSTNDRCHIYHAVREIEYSLNSIKILI